MTLTLIGSGISFDLTLSAIDALASADLVYIETYTNPIDDEEISILEEKIGKKIKRLPRRDVESSYLIDRAQNQRVCLISSGDPLTATTHITLVLDAKTKNVEVKIIPNSSIYSTAPARAGLQIYRFGKTASLVNPRENYAPTSSLDIIRKNLELNMHSLVLLDTEPEPMEAKTALEMLSEFDSAVVISKLGAIDEKITYGKISELSEKDLGKPPFAIIIPAKLHILEDEFLKTLE
ncbi:MAG: diphthine synthase [Candidatus Micrarchaeota archaeon]|nr:diphthine synthase [Candidatus Micrarchaeota archaeon]